MPVGERTLRCVGGPFDGLECAVHGERRISLPTSLRIPSSDDVRSKNGPVSAGAVIDYDVRRLLAQDGPVSAGAVIDYDVRRLLAQDGKWHDFLVLSALTSMQATVWINRRSSAR